MIAIKSIPAVKSRPTFILLLMMVFVVFVWSITQQYMLQVSLQSTTRNDSRLEGNIIEFNTDERQNINTTNTMKTKEGNIEFDTDVEGINTTMKKKEGNIEFNTDEQNINTTTTMKKKEGNIEFNTDEEGLNITTTMKKIEEFRKRRNGNFSSFYEEVTTPQGKKVNQLKPNIDADGPILDFAIAGFAKCGTTTMLANLGYLAPMPIADICTAISPNTLHYAYNDWPKEYDNVTNPTKILRGTKCPRGVNSWTGQSLWLDDLSLHLPKTLIIIGIRHPVKFFESFWHMITDNNLRQRNSSPYDTIDYRSKNEKKYVEYECGYRQLVCTAKTRFHIPLARAGKTALDEKERELLAPDDIDGGMKLVNHQIKNPIFIYELSEIKSDDMWDTLAKLLQVPYIRHDKHQGNNTARHIEKKKWAGTRLNFCDAEYDDFRAYLMPHAYNMSSWFCNYLVPAAKDENINVYMTDPDRFCDLVRSYVEDPCDRLHRLDNGTYVLRDDMNVTGGDIETRW